MKPGRLGKSNEQYWIWITNENAVGWVISRTQLGSPKIHHIAPTTWASTMDSLGRKAADRPQVIRFNCLKLHSLFANREYRIGACL